MRVNSETNYTQEKQWVSLI